MFNKQKFCHVASNNRNEQKIGVFVYKTTDDLETVTASGYFNEKIIDINLHDLIIHEKYDAIDRTKVERNLLCVTERTLTNVGTTVIKSKLEEEIEETIEQLPTTYLKTDGTSTMTGPLNLKNTANDKVCSIEKYMNSGLKFSCSGHAPYVIMSLTSTTASINPSASGSGDLGAVNLRWGTLYVNKLNNGYNIAVPVTNSADTLALKSQVDLAANSGRMITDQGLWYAKMDSATVAPAAEDGTNYADFSQVDTGGNPIIVTYSRVNGAWEETDIIVPPADYDGYVPITSKIWDIPEQTGQQGGRILWNHTSKEFTPYPTIVSFDSISVTGESTVTMPATPVSAQIVNKDYVDSKVLIFDYDSVTYADIEDAKSGSEAPIIIQNNNRTYVYAGTILNTHNFCSFYGDHISRLTIANDSTKTVVNYPALNNHVVIEFQEPTALNNYTWYRKYADGWVEQGGIGTSSLTVTLPVTMSDTNYTITLACNNYSANAGTAIAVYYDKATTGFNLQGRWNGGAQNGINVCWEVKGMYAQP